MIDSALTDAALTDDGVACVCGRLRRTSRALTRRYDEALAPAGITVGQFSALRTLNRLERASLVELSEALVLEKSALWRNLQPLERQGWVAAASEKGVRGHRLSLTPAGREKLAEALPYWRAAQARVAETPHLKDVMGSLEAALISLPAEIETDA